MAITTEIEAALVLCSALSAKAKGLLASVQSVDFTSNIIWPQGPPNGLLQADLVEAAARAVELAAAAEGSRGEGSRAQDEGGKANCKSPGEDHRQALWLRMSQEDAQLLKDAQLQHAQVRLIDMSESQAIVPTAGLPNCKPTPCLQALQQQENVHRCVCSSNVRGDSACAPSFLLHCPSSIFSFFPSPFSASFVSTSSAFP
jgi:hypothetical protein